ncbi:MAG: glycosyltransferase, partial [Acidimicrobiia bacterium]
MSLPMAVKRALRPLIPDRVMARYRLHQHSRHSRTNVEVFLTDPGEARKWLGATPDTYRVRLSLPDGPAPKDMVEVDHPGLEVSEQQRRAVRAVLADSEIGAAVVGEVSPPRLVDRRRAEPPVGPRLIVARGEVFEEVGGAPHGDLPGLLARLRDAGHRIGLIPVPVTSAPVARTDPIEAPAVVILAAVPLHDVGGGARSTQLALELVRQGYHVSLVSLYEAQESVDLGLRYVHPRLEQYGVTGFDPSLLAVRVASPGMVLAEAPAAPLAEAGFALQEAGWRLVYDMIDDWSDPALGGDWYRQEVEQALLERAEAVVASAPDLVARVESMGSRARLVPNAVNAEIFGVSRPARPADLPEAPVIIGYHGSLYGEWFDWEAVASVAEAYPEAAIVLIGDDKASRPEMPQNVVFLGLKPQADLPAYLQRFTVGIIPFKVSATTHAVSPLKAYEYLASGVPIAAPPLRALEGLEGVYVSEDLTEAVKLALTAPRPDRRRVLAEHSWARR